MPAVKSALEKVRQAPDSTKARILRAAQEVFARKGFDGASTREIAAHAEVNISSLHYHWDSKETLYQAIFESIYLELQELLEGLIGNIQEGDGRNVARQAIRLIFDFYVDNPTVPRLLMRRIMETDNDPEREHDLIGAPWQTFAQWTQAFGEVRLAEIDVNFFMLTIQSVLLVVMTGSPHVSAMLGGDITDPDVRSKTRDQVSALVERLVFDK